MRYFLIVILTTCISMACIAQDAGDQIDPARVAEAQANLEAKEQARKAATRPATAPSPAQGANVTSDDTAKKKYEAAKAAAEEAFNNAMLAADQQYLNDLNSALKQALANQDVDAVRRIDDERKAAASDLTALQSLRLNGPGKRTALAPPSTVHRVIYLCDGSGSLVGGKDQALEKELNEGVSSLDVSQMFNVVIFQENKPNQKPYHFISTFPSLKSADAIDKAKLNDFLANVLDFHGTTDPIPGLVEAFRENPETIYLITDAGFDDSKAVVAKINELNKNKTVKVNTVLLLSNARDPNKDFEVLMSKIAVDNGGVFLKVYADGQ